VKPAHLNGEQGVSQVVTVTLEGYDQFAGVQPKILPLELALKIVHITLAFKASVQDKQHYYCYQQFHKPRFDNEQC
jgi:hypothetical protein